MPLIVRNPPRRGVAIGDDPSQPKQKFVVLKAIANGMKIAGKRRAQGEVFEARPSHVHFLELEGLIGPAPADPAPAAAAKKTPPASPAAAAS